MAKNHAIRTARLTDRQVLDLVQNLKDNVKLFSARVTLIDGIDIEMKDKTVGDGEDEQLVKLYSDRHAILKAVVLTRGGITISFYRGICANLDTPAVNRQSSPYFDEIFFENNGKETPDKWRHIVECIEIVEEMLPGTFPIQDVDSAQTTVDLLQAEMHGLAEQYKEMLGDMARERAELWKNFEDRRKSLEQEQETARKQVKDEAEERKRQFEIHKEKEIFDLQKKEADLEKREQELDDRQHMHARRELRQQITDSSKTRIGRPVISRRASGLRWTVFFLTILAGLGAGYLGVENFQDLIEYTEKDLLSEWLLITWVIRGTILLFLAVGFVAYAINWLRLVYLDDVRTERHYESYGNDIDRASFVIETIMEIGEKEKTEVPDAWIEGACRNLFTDKGDDNYGKVPPNTAAMLFESIAGAKFGPEGTEVTMGRRDARRFAKRLDDGK